MFLRTYWCHDVPSVTETSGAGIWKRRRAANSAYVQHLRQVRGPTPLHNTSPSYIELHTRTQCMSWEENSHIFLLSTRLHANSRFFSRKIYCTSIQHLRSRYSWLALTYLKRRAWLRMCVTRLQSADYLDLETAYCTRHVDIDKQFAETRTNIVHDRWFIFCANCVTNKQASSSQHVHDGNALRRRNVVTDRLSQTISN